MNALELRYIELTYPEVYSYSEKQLKWVFKSRKTLSENFAKKFPRSPFEFVAQIPTKRGTVLVTSDPSIKPVGKVAFLSWSVIKKMGCPVK